MTVTGVVLCGGASSRMGRDKASLELLGKPLALWVAEALASAGADPVVAHGGSPPAGLTVEPDSRPGAGPLAALVDALERHGDVLVCPTDVPTVPTELLAELLERGRDSGALAVLAYSDRLEPLIGHYSAAALNLLREGLAAGGRGPTQVLTDYHYETVSVAPEQVLNVNTPPDLATAERLLREHGIDSASRV